ncbi:MAG TPA: FixH family protein [Gemmatimonadaceae bacterium]|nr:FixH family protein [Gemmatimonadaceae bacterium]
MKRGLWWPIGVAAILATTVAANIWVMMIASDDPSFAIEEDYYRKALAWDTTLAQAARNTALGWHLTPAMGPIASDGRAVLTAQLMDSLGAVIPNAVVKVSALPVARATEVREATLVADDAGTYAARLDARRPGQWELRFDATVGTERFTQVSRVEVGVQR